MSGVSGVSEMSGVSGVSRESEVNETSGVGISGISEMSEMSEIEELIRVCPNTAFVLAQKSSADIAKYHDELNLAISNVKTNTAIIMDCKYRYSCEKPFLEREGILLQWELRKDPTNYSIKCELDGVNCKLKCLDERYSQANKKFAESYLDIFKLEQKLKKAIAIYQFVIPKMFEQTGHVCLTYCTVQNDIKCYEDKKRQDKKNVQ